MTDINTVKEFWEDNPLWSGESGHKEGSKEFYLEHRKIYFEDCFAGDFDIRFLPPPRINGQNLKVLDLGCGIGFWSTEFAMRGYGNLYAADLTKKALMLTESRLKIYGVTAKLSQQNAEKTTFDYSFLITLIVKG